jgi:uncharacterized protein YegL
LKPYNYIQLALGIVLASLIGLTWWAYKPSLPINNLPVNNNTTECVLVMDVSQSMLAQDVQPSRWQIAQQTAIELINKNPNTLFGIISFAGSEEIKSPLTSNQSYILNQINNINIEPAFQGSHIVAAIQTAAWQFNPLKNNRKIIYVLTDGEGEETEYAPLVNKLQQQQVQVYMHIIGTSAGSPIPALLGNDFVKNNNGQVVISKAETKNWENLCQATGGEIAQNQQPISVWENNTLSFVANNAINNEPNRYVFVLVLCIIIMSIIFILFHLLKPKYVLLPLIFCTTISQAQNTSLEALHNGDLARAQSLLNQTNPSPNDIFCNAYLLHTAKNYNAAVAKYKLVISAISQTNKQIILFNLALALHQAGDDEEAFYYVKQFLAKDFTNPEALFLLKKINENLYQKKNRKQPKEDNNNLQKLEAMENEYKLQLRKVVPGNKNMTW